MKRALTVSLALISGTLLRPLRIALESNDLLPWVLIVLFALLPDAVEAILRWLPSPTATLTPDPALPDSELLSSFLRELSSAATRTPESSRPLRLHLRPLPASRGRLVLRLLPHHVEALLLPSSAPLPLTLSKHEWDHAPTAPFPVSRTPMPALFEVPSAEGIWLTFRPQSTPDPAPLLLVQTPLRNGTWAHSPLVLFAAPFLALLLTQGHLLVLAASLGLVTHGIVDACGETGLPRRTPYLPGIACHFWRDRDPAVLRLLLFLTLMGLGLALLLQTSWLLHRDRVCAVFLIAMALISYLQKRRAS